MVEACQCFLVLGWWQLRVGDNFHVVLHQGSNKQEELDISWLNLPLQTLALFLQKVIGYVPGASYIGHEVLEGAC